MAIMENTKRTATVIAKERCILLSVPGPVFKAVKKELDHEANAPLDELSEVSEAQEAEPTETVERTDVRIPAQPLESKPPKPRIQTSKTFSFHLSPRRRMTTTIFQCLSFAVRDQLTSSRISRWCWT